MREEGAAGCRTKTAGRGASLAVIIPAYNEAGSIGRVLDDLPRAAVAQVIVVDNGSTDGTGEEARRHGALVVCEPRRGYGAACLAGMTALDDRVEIVVFLDADHSDYPEELPQLVAPIVSGKADLVIGSRTLGQCQRGAVAPHARWGNRLAVTVLRFLFGVRFTDLGPFRAVRADALRSLGMRDLDYGWTVEMQARAVRAGLRVTEVPVSYRRRIGRSKVSGTVRGSLRAGYKILATIWRVWRERGATPQLPSVHLLQGGRGGRAIIARDERITVVIPTLDEAGHIGPCLAGLVGQEGSLEVIVVDGGSTDRTVAVASEVSGVQVVDAPRGRGAQMSAGAALATGDILWFLHADCRPPANATTAIREALAHDGVSGGAFRFALDGNRGAYRLVEWGVWLRCRWLQLPYGDQGIFLRRETFDALGGYRETPLFEDLYLVRALRRRGRVVTIPETLPTSSRRCARDGVLSTVLRNQALLIAERLGVPPERLVSLRAPARASYLERKTSEECRKAGSGDPVRPLT